MLSAIANFTAQVQSLNEQIQNGIEDNDALRSHIENLTSQIELLIEEINQPLGVFTPHTNEFFHQAVDEWLEDSGRCCELNLWTY